MELGHGDWFAWTWIGNTSSSAMIPDSMWIYFLIICSLIAIIGCRYTEAAYLKSRNNKYSLYLSCLGNLFVQKEIEMK